jgi:hypothetical protein
MAKTHIMLLVAFPRALYDALVTRSIFKSSLESLFVDAMHQVAIFFFFYKWHASVLVAALEPRGLSELVM